MFSKSMTSKDTFLEQTKAAREERALEKKREQSAVKIQAYVRGWLARRRFLRMILYGQLYLAIFKFNVFFKSNKSLIKMSKFSNFCCQFFMDNKQSIYI